MKYCTTIEKNYFHVLTWKYLKISYELKIQQFIDQNMSYVSIKKLKYMKKPRKTKTKLLSFGDKMERT